MNSIYVIGSLRNPQVPIVAKAIRSIIGIEAFDDWFAAGPTADDCWQEYETERGNSYGAGLQGYAAGHVFAFDKEHLDRCEAAVLVMPAGKSGHLELGYCIGKGKRGYVLFDKEPERWDVMYQFAEGGVFFDIDTFVSTLAAEQVDKQRSNGSAIVRASFHYPDDDVPF